MLPRVAAADQPVPQGGGWGTVPPEAFAVRGEGYLRDSQKVNANATPPPRAPERCSARFHGRHATEPAPSSPADSHGG